MNDNTTQNNSATALHQATLSPINTLSHSKPAFRLATLAGCSLAILLPDTPRLGRRERGTNDAAGGGGRGSDGTVINENGAAGGLGGA